MAKKPDCGGPSSAGSASLEALLLVPSLACHRTGQREGAQRWTPAEAL